LSEHVIYVYANKENCDKLPDLNMLRPLDYSQVSWIDGATQGLFKAHK